MTKLQTRGCRWKQSHFVMATRWQLGYKKRLHENFFHITSCLMSLCKWLIKQYAFCLICILIKLFILGCCVKCTQRYGVDGLKLMNHEETVSFGQAVLKLTFDPGSPDYGMLTAECRLDHPFFVKNKGATWELNSFLLHANNIVFIKGFCSFQVGLHSIQA